MTSFDSSARMVDLVRQRPGDEAALHGADIAGPLPLSDRSFDVAIASLALRYLG